MKALPFDDSWKAVPCKLQTVNVGQKGYARILVDGVEVRIHRAVFEAAYGPIPEGKEICHKCNVRNCWELSHLYAGTHQENVAQATVEGRMAKKLTAEDVLTIKTLLKKPPKDLSVNDFDKALADYFGVTKMSISKIRRGLVWRHL